MAAPKLPLAPRHPDRICWGCDRYCPADDMYCGNGTIRAPHPIELFGDDWQTAFDAPAADAPELSTPPPPSRSSGR